MGQNNGKTIGIDLGTTNSVVSIIEGGERANKMLADMVEVET